MSPDDLKLRYWYKGKRYREDELGAERFAVTARSGGDTIAVFDEERFFLDWAQRQNVREEVDRLERTIEAARGRRDEAAELEQTQREKREAIAQRIQDLAEDNAVNLGALSREDRDVFLRQITLDRTDDPVFDPAVLYEDVNLGGRWLPVWGALPDLRWLDFDDKVSSWWIAGAGVFFDSAWYEGRRYYTFGVPAGGFFWIGPAWRNAVSSVALP